MARHHLRVTPETAVADDRVRRIGIHIRHRRVVEVEPQRPDLLGERLGKLLGAAEVVHVAHAAKRWPRSLPDPLDPSAFLVHRQESGAVRADERREFPVQFPDLCGLLDIALEQDESRRRRRLDEVPERRVHAGTGKPDHQTLPGTSFALCE